ncbi:MAG: ribbon-helix-helix protein, CopG family [Proteobacteria bacterium]|nr:ribbon-helix-helix protein, CopG family [Pseudomonadota bacterium]
MTAFTVRLPDEAHARLKNMAKRRKISMNKLFEEMTTITLTEFDAETRFRAKASRGSGEHGLELLETLRQRFKESGRIPKDD